MSLDVVGLSFLIGKLLTPLDELSFDGTLMLLLLLLEIVLNFDVLDGACDDGVGFILKASRSLELLG